MKLSDVKTDSVLKIEDITVKDENVLRRLSEIGVSKHRSIRFIKKSKLSKCVLIESLGAVFILDGIIAQEIECYE